MAEVTILEYKILTDESVKNVHDLQENIKVLKQVLADEKATTEENAQAAELLRKNQNALRDAMYQSTKTTEEQIQAGKRLFDENGKAVKSYNELVHTMAELKMAWRSTSDETKRAKLGEEINKINNELKEMDASVGNFQRNVGNYQSAFKNWSENVDVLRKGLGAATGGLNGIKDGFEGLSKSPAIATFSILVSLAIRLAGELKENETAMAAIKKAMAALQPIMDFFGGILEKVAEYLADIITKVVTFVTNNGLISKIINGLVGVGNAILQFVIAPFKGIVAAIKTLQDEGIKGLRNAAKAFGNEMKQGVAFKSNYQAGQVMAETVASGYKSKKKEIVEVAKETAEEAGEEIVKTFEERVSDAINGVMKSLEEGDKKADAAIRERMAFQKEMNDQLREEAEQVIEDLDNYWKNEEKVMQDRITTIQTAAGSVSSIFSSLADLYESDAENSKKAAEKAKALRIAGATIDTISGAISAFMSTWKSELPLTAKSILAPINAASVIAAGMAQVAKIRSTKVDGNATQQVSASVSAPAISYEMPNVRSVTSASEEIRLNKMSQDQRVYILASDIQASQNQIKTQVAETSF